MKHLPGPVALLTLLLSSFAASAEELDADLKVSGRAIAVQVRHKDGSAAKGVRLRLLYGRQFAIVTSRTDAEGRWTHTADRSGAYDLLVETGPNAEDVLHLPFAAIAAEEPVGFRMVPGVSGTLCLFLAILLVGVRGGKGARVLIASTVLLALGESLLVWSVWPQPQPVLADADVAGAARDFLRIEDVKPLSGPLETLLASAADQRIKTQPHPLLGTVAPQVELSDHRKQTWRLRDRLERGPVVLVFYYGYHCNHCVGQLFALHDDMARFRELGAEVVAISADPPELTRERFRQYGEFGFPVLTDPGNKLAKAFGVYQPASGTMPEDLQHGTFVIGRDGHVQWARYGSEPFTGNLTLLYELARLEGRLPPAKRE